MLSMMRQALWTCRITSIAASRLICARQRAKGRTPRSPMRLSHGDCCIALFCVGLEVPGAEEAPCTATTPIKETVKATHVRESLMTMPTLNVVAIASTRPGDAPAIRVRHLGDRFARERTEFALGKADRHQRIGRHVGRQAEHRLDLVLAADVVGRDQR